MKKIAYILGLIVLASSCQKVIDVDLNESSQVIVIEGNFTAKDSTVRVKISLTSSYFNSDPSMTVDNALVSITDGNGVVSVVPSIGNGVYELTSYDPTFDMEYTLTVNGFGEVYTAKCNLVTPVALKPITYQFFDGFFGAEGGYAAFMNFNDPAGVENYYLAVLGLNGEVFDNIDEVFLQNDQLTDGNFIQRPLFANDFFDIGDTVFMELRAVDKIAFDYTSELQSIAGGSNSAAPGNPTTNWNNGALGFFNAYGVSQDTVIIQ